MDWIPKPGTVSKFEVVERTKKPERNIEDPEIWKERTTKQRHVHAQLGMKGNFAPMLGLMGLQLINAMTGGAMFAAGFIRRRLADAPAVETSSECQNWRCHSTCQKGCAKPETSSFGIYLCLALFCGAIGILLGALMKRKPKPRKSSLKVIPLEGILVTRD